VLLVGDDEWIPTWSYQLPSYDWAQTDLSYTTFDGASDIIPNTILGRLPVHSEDELATYLTKLTNFYQIKWYEGWMKKISFIATDEPDMAVSTEANFEKIIAAFTQPNGYKGTFPVDADFPDFMPGGDRLFPKKYGATRQDVLDALTNKRVALVFNGIGTSTSFEWATDHLFKTTEVDALNSYPVPLVAALAPYTADYLESHSMADAWMLNSDSGALTYIGATGETFIQADQILAEGVFRGLFSSYSVPLSIGEAFQTGLKLVETMTGDEKEYYVGYQLFGDPSLTIRFPEGALLAAPFSHFIAPWGGTVTLPITIKNVGPAEETFEVLIDSNCDYPIINNPNPFDLTLSAGAATVIPVTIQIVTDYPVGTSDIITITAAQKPEKIIKTSLTATFQVFKPSVFFPIIYR